MYNEATDAGGSETQGTSGSTQHQFVETGFGLQCLSLFSPSCSLPPPPPSILSLTRCNFVVSSVPAGCDNPLLLIILNQEGLSLSLSISLAVSLPLSLCSRQTKWRRMKHVRNLFKDSREDGLSSKKAL